MAAATGHAIGPKKNGPDGVSSTRPASVFDRVDQKLRVTFMKSVRPSRS